MKTQLLNLVLLGSIIFLLNSCTKAPIQLLNAGVYLAQTNSPFGGQVNINTNNTAVFYTQFGNHYTSSFYTQGYFIHFNNGFTAEILDANTIIFTETIDYLNPDYTDWDGDGLDDWNPSLPQYYTESYHYTYYRQ